MSKSPSTHLTAPTAPPSYEQAILTDLHDACTGQENQWSRMQQHGSLPTHPCHCVCQGLQQQKLKEGNQESVLEFTIEEELPCGKCMKIFLGVGFVIVILSIIGILLYISKYF
eukprot:GFUD01025739.1.p1 GENE.GFUD01025739.1~~GFUD01025739.1.p1  ORF type:complete len:113 (+),score=8.41 GFUD01025739.1:51-389(+)